MLIIFFYYYQYKSIVPGIIAWKYIKLNITFKFYAALDTIFIISIFKLVLVFEFEKFFPTLSFVFTSTFALFNIFSSSNLLTI